MDPNVSIDCLGMFDFVDCVNGFNHKCLRSTNTKFKGIADIEKLSNR